MEVEKASSSEVVPLRVAESVRRTLANIEELEANFDQFLSLSDPDVLAELPPLERARSLLMVSKVTSTLFAVKLRCSGVDPLHHQMKGELERLSQYQGKLEQYLARSRAPLRPSTTLNCQAATRFIEHSLPDLTPEQRESMREISKFGYHLQKNNQRKRKYESAEKPSVRAAAQEFLEKAARELLGENKGDFKGPIAPSLLQNDLVEIDDDDNDEDDSGNGNNSYAPPSSKPQPEIVEIDDD